MLYKYCRTDGFDILLKSRLKVSKINSFNDPFELDFGIDIENARKSIECEYYDNLATTNIHVFCADLLARHGLEFNTVDEMLDKITRLQVSKFKEAKKIIKTQWNNEYGIICLSERPDIIQMWAHYCSNHEGIVIGFDEDVIVGTDKDVLVRLDYKKEGMFLWPVNIKFEESKHGMMLKNVMEIKEHGWSYEKEIRTYVSLDEIDDDGNYYYNISPSSIKEIYLGLRSKEETKIIAESLLCRYQYKHVKLYIMEKHDSTFKLVAKTIDIKLHA